MNVVNPGDGPDPEEQKDGQDQGLDPHKNMSNSKKEKLRSLSGDVFGAEDDPTPASLISINSVEQARVRTALGMNRDDVAGSGPSTEVELKEKVKDLTVRLKLYERLQFKTLY